MSIRRSILSVLVANALALTAVSAQAAVQPSELVAPIAEYKVYVDQNVAQLVKETKVFVAAVKAGNIDKAKSLFAPVRTHYERVEPVAELFSDMDAAIDSRADDHEKREEDPGFGGFHRIEHALWVTKDTKSVEKYADELQANVEELHKRLTDLTFPPEKVVGGAAALMEEVAATKISGEEDRYSHTDLYDFEANFQGAYKIVELFKPLIAREDKAFLAKTEKNFDTVFTILKKYKTKSGGFESYDKLSETDRKILSGRVNTLAEDLSKLRGMFGLN
ncbi:iron uptake system protein EfeO [Lautropia dentalis]|uniref:Iron uptake system protein EfeO n=2 Tax=Lautropia dentalis TaxID=2490857 RepID=A0A3R8LQ23_9BURK|nr:iron uptake system protein EfeO [Lautropia dentalis]RRN45975.1 iron uptake system protein EfeO [Lautropia dentalis]